MSAEYCETCFGTPCACLSLGPLVSSNPNQPLEAGLIYKAGDSTPLPLKPVYSESAVVITRWNRHREYHCKHHPAVEGMSYQDVHAIFHTSGCHPVTSDDWSVMGQIRNVQGVLVVCPGQCVVDLFPGFYLVLNYEDAKRMFPHAPIVNDFTEEELRQWNVKPVLAS
jgi:hypothetical protein